jgi:hypothetical protein
MPGPGNGPAAECRVILGTWRANPSFDFPPPYDRYGPVLARLAGDSANARLIDGVVVRIGRGDEPEAIDGWAAAFASRRGLTWPGAN